MIDSSRICIVNKKGVCVCVCVCTYLNIKAFKCMCDLLGFLKIMPPQLTTCVQRSTYLRVKDIILTSPT